MDNSYGCENYGSTTAYNSCETVEQSSTSLSNTGSPHIYYSFIVGIVLIFIAVVLVAQSKRRKK